MASEPTDADAAMYMEICSVFLARAGGEVIIPDADFPMKKFSIWSRFVDETEGGPGLALRLVQS